jgi:response regulator RpfG family c-di-GMP phosphodiesterase
MEQQGLDMSMDELLGNFNPAAIMMAGAANAPARNMSMLNQSNGTLVEYLIRTYVETFIQPVLRLLILLEQEYETDRVILGLAAKNAKLLQRFGVDEVTDELLNQEITLTVNVGMGATDPGQKLQKFLTAMNMYSGMLRNPVPGVNMVEVGKEIFGHLGYQDGSRFFTVDNPEVAQLQQQLRVAMQQMQQMQQQLKEKSEALMVSLQKTKETNQTKERIAQLQEENENRRALARHFTQIMGSQEDMPMPPPAQPAPRAAPATKPVSPLVEAKLAAEVEALRTENQLRLKKIESMDAEIQAQQSVALQQLTARTAAVQEAVSGLKESTSIIGESIGDALGVAVEKMAATMGEAVGKVGDAVQEVGSAVNNFTDTSLENTERALQAISKPKRVVREKGRISRIETE